LIIVQGEILLGPPAGLGEMERGMFDAKQAFRTSYAYNTVDELRFELRTRVLLTEAAIALNESGAQFAVFRDSRCNPRLWNRNEKGGFELLPYTSPAAGIRNIFEEGMLYAFECATAIVIVLYKGLLDAMGETLFNAWFGGLLLYDWHYDKDLLLVDSKKPEEALPGDVQYFKNPDVEADTPEWQGENALRMTEDLFYGHGVGVKPAEEIILSLNRKRRPFSVISAYLTDTVVHPDYPVLYRTIIGGGGYPREGRKNSGWARIGSRHYTC
jgi:protein-glutamine gamma-glutamyltransferase